MNWAEMVLGPLDKSQTYTQNAQQVLTSFPSIFVIVCINVGIKTNLTLDQSFLIIICIFILQITDLKSSNTGGALIVGEQISVSSWVHSLWTKRGE